MALIVYPSPGTESFRSSTYTMTAGPVGGTQSVCYVYNQTYVAETQNMVWSTGQSVPVNWITIGTDETVDCRIKLVSGNINSAIVYPKNIGIIQEITAGILRLLIPANTRIRIEINGDRLNALNIFTSPIEETPADSVPYTNQTAVPVSGAIHFTPGYYVIPSGLVLNNNCTLTIQGGAVVFFQDPDTYGTVSTATSTSISVAGSPWTIAQFNGADIKITGGPGAGQVREITTSTSNTINISSAWSTTPTSSSTFVIMAARRAGFDLTALNILNTSGVRLLGNGWYGSFAVRANVVSCTSFSKQIKYAAMATETSLIPKNVSVIGPSFVRWPFYMQFGGSHYLKNVQYLSPWSFNTNAFNPGKKSYTDIVSTVEDCFGFTGDDTCILFIAGQKTFYKNVFAVAGRANAFIIDYFGAAIENVTSSSVIDSHAMQLAEPDGGFIPVGAQCIISCWVDQPTSNAKTHGCFNSIIKNLKVWGPLYSRLFSLENKLYPFGEVAPQDAEGQIFNITLENIDCEYIPDQVSRIVGLNSISTPHDLSLTDIRVGGTLIDVNNYKDYVTVNEYPYAIRWGGENIETIFSPVVYSYTVSPLSSVGTTIAYSYGSSVYDEVLFPQEGYKSASTQEILNNLPQWMKMRQSFDSTGWKLVNSWGMSLENVAENIRKNLEDFTLTTTSTSKFSKLYYCDVDSKQLLEGRQSRNLLFNSSFTIKDAVRTNLPAAWSDYGIDYPTYLDYRNSIMSPVSISSDTGKLKVTQEILLDNVSINKATASFYLNSSASLVDAKILIAVEKMDGTSVSFTITSNKQSTEWTRVVLPITLNSNVYRLTFSIICDCTSKVSICAPQLELGGLTSWTSSTLDFIPYLRSSSLFNTVYSVPIDNKGKKIPIFNISSERDFIDASIPTRIEKTSAPNKELVFTENKLFGKKISVLGELTDIEFDIVEGTVKERATGPSIWDFFGSYSIKDLRYYSGIEYGTVDDSSVVITPLATGIRKDYLFVICKEEYAGTTRRILKIVRPRTPPNGQTYLEAFIDFDLGINFTDILDLDQNTDDEISAILFSEIDPTYMVIVTTNNIKHYYKLYFDYYYFNSSNNRLYTIEPYKNSKISIL